MAVAEVVDLVVEELRGLTRTPVPGEELQRAKDHLKGSCVLGLESTTSRMSQLAQCEMYFGRQVPRSETLAGIDRVCRGRLAASGDGPVSGGCAGRDIGGTRPLDVAVAAQLDLG